MRNELFVKSFNVQAAVAAYRICKHGTADDTAVQAAAATAAVMGVSNSVGAAATDDTVDVVLAGIAEVEYGGNVTRGALLTSDADGKAIAATTTGQFIVGQAMVSGVSGDIGSCLVAPGTFAAAA